MGAACLEERERDFTTLNFEASQLHGEVARLRKERNDARRESPSGGESQLQEDLHGAKPWAEETESSLREVNARLEETDSELSREHNAVGG